jgi:pimeloyl-ACP methyl ester carboxylesterase
MMRTGLWIAGILALVYAVMCMTVFFRQRSLIYYPQRSSVASEANLLRLATPEGDVLVSEWPQSGPRALLYFGGNAEAVSGSVPALANAFPDHALYGMHYRGYDGSAGSPTEDALRHDALALYDRVSRAHPEVVIMGRSLGSGVAVWLASQRPASRLILVTPFDSLQEVAAAHFPYLPLKWLMLDKYESWRFAPAVNAPTLILEAEKDEIIPGASTRALARHFRPGLVTYRVVAEAHHNSISDHPEYLGRLRAVR